MLGREAPLPVTYAGGARTLVGPCSPCHLAQRQAGRPCLVVSRHPAPQPVTCPSGARPLAGSSPCSRCGCILPGSYCQLHRAPGTCHCLAWNRS